MRNKTVTEERLRPNLALTSQFAINRRATNAREPAPIATTVLGVDELANLFRCSTEKVKRLARSGKLPAFKVGKSWFVRERDLELYIDRVLASARPKRH